MRYWHRYGKIKLVLSYLAVSLLSESRRLGYRVDMHVPGSAPFALKTTSQQYQYIPSPIPEAQETATMAAYVLRCVRLSRALPFINKSTIRPAHHPDVPALRPLVNYQPAQITGTRAVSTHRYLEQSAIPPLAFFAPRDAESVNARPPLPPANKLDATATSQNSQGNRGRVCTKDEWSGWGPGLRLAEPGKRYFA